MAILPQPKALAELDRLSQKSKQYGIVEVPRQGRDLPYDTTVFLLSMP